MYAQTRVPGNRVVFARLRAEVLWTTGAGLQTSMAVPAEPLSGEVAPLDSRPNIFLQNQEFDPGKNHGVQMKGN